MRLLTVPDVSGPADTVAFVSALPGRVGPTGQPASDCKKNPNQIKAISKCLRFVAKLHALHHYHVTRI